MKWCMCRWEEDTEGVHVDLRQKSLDWLAECFEAAHQTARQAIDFMCNFIGMKVCQLRTFLSRHLLRPSQPRMAAPMTAPSTMCTRGVQIHHSG